MIRTTIKHYKNKIIEIANRYFRYYKIEIVLLFLFNIILSCFCYIFHYLEHRKIPTVNFVILNNIFGTVMLLLMCLIPKEKIPEKVIIPPIPQYVHVYQTLKDKLPDDNIRLVISYLYVGNPYHLNFSGW